MSERIVRTRFAPSPTGYMHIGNLRSALYEYLVAKSQNGKFILRIEDTDRDRVVEGAVDIIYQTLKTCGLTYDEGPDIGGPHAPYIQSERRQHYLPHAEHLIKEDKAYYCFCGKDKSIQENEYETSGKFYSYDRRCRNLPAAEIKAHLDAGSPYVIRQKMPLTGSTCFRDEVFGEIKVENEELEDQILIKSDGFPTYNFANVVDDHEMGITHVVRGSEYLSSTPKYNLLYEAFGWEIPTYIHLPLILGEDGSKLSKRHGATSFNDLVKLGYLPEAIVNYIAFLGWAPGGDTREIFSLAELEETFSVAGISKSPAIFSYAKLDWFNEQYLRALNLNHFAQILKPYSDKVFTGRPYDLELLAQILQTRTTKLSDIPDMISFFNEADPLYTELFKQKRSKLTPEKAGEIIDDLIVVLDTISVWTGDVIKDSLNSYTEDLGHKTGQVMGALRASLSGRSVTPGGAIEILVILGKEESLKRLTSALQFLRQSS